MTENLKKQLTAMAVSGSTDREISAVLGRLMSPDEVVYVRQIRAKVKVKRAVARQQPKSLADRVADHRARSREVDIPICENPKRRDACRLDFLKWIKTYKPRKLAYSQDHLRVIARMQHAVLNGGLYVLACWRSFGKTMLSEDCAEWATLYRHKRFVLLIGATKEAAQQMASSILSDLEENDLIAADFPEICTPLRGMEGHAQRAMFQTFHGERLHAAAKSGMIAFPFIAGDEERPAARGQIIVTLGLTGRLRGLKRTLADGTSVRPDLAIPDDPQTDQSARSPEQCNVRERLIVRAVGASGGPGATLSVIMPCTVIAAGDLSSRFLDSKQHPEYMREQCRLVQAWPKAQKTLWEEYRKLRAEAIDSGDASGKAATKFYRAHRAEMDDGAVVSWPQWREAGELSGIQHVENMLIRYGEAGFAAEFQNAPMEEGAGDAPYRLTPELICSRIAEREPMEIPPWVTNIVAATDLNPSYALTSTVIGFGRDQSAAVLWYGLFTSAPLPIPGDLPDTEFHKRLFGALTIHGKQLAALQCRPEMWAIDANGKAFPTVMRFTAAAQSLCGISAIGTVSPPGKSYKPFGKNVIGRPREFCHMRGDVADGRRRKWLSFHSEYWAEVSQRAWLGAVGAPGAISLFKGQHQDFATQICREQLKGKGEVGGQMFWNFHTQPGPHDFGDVVKMCYVSAAWQGIGTGGAITQRSYVETRKCRVQRDAI